NVQKENCILFLRPRVNGVDQAIGHPQTVLAIPARKTLGDDRDEVESRLHWMRGIGLLPGGDFLIELGEHLVRRQLPKNSHPLGKRISIVGHYPAPRQDGSRKLGRRSYRPGSTLQSSLHRAHQSNAVLLGPSRNRRHRHWWILGGR